MLTLHLASANIHKLEEFTRLFAPYTLLQPIHLPSSIPPCIEDGLTFLDNAIKKALYYSTVTPGLILADDSGIAVGPLGGQPGIYSARYAGPRATDAENRRLLLERLSQLPDEGAARDAAFICALALARDGQILTTVEASCPGSIVRSPKGTGGFGYDSLFLPSGALRTFAEMPPEEKDRYSHRGRAVANLLSRLALWVENDPRLPLSPALRLDLSQSLPPKSSNESDHPRSGERHPHGGAHI
nr:non-canonical purine NTP pyrophosphatase [Methylacidimicrobium cyclopophantes]